MNKYEIALLYFVADVYVSLTKFEMIANHLVS